MKDKYSTAMLLCGFDIPSMYYELPPISRAGKKHLHHKPFPFMGTHNASLNKEIYMGT